MRQHLLDLLDGEEMFAGAKRALEGIPAEARAKRVRGLPYTLWDLLEHLRLTQKDILNYLRDADYSAPEWPTDYWPASHKPDDGAWEVSEKQFFQDLRAIKRMVREGALFKVVPCGVKGHTLLREVLVLAGHNAYHLGQVVLMRRLLGAWSD